MMFSIIIPAHNAADRLDKVLSSVSCQTFTDFELIVVCDACEDNSAEIAAGYGAKVLITDYRSQGGACNTGLEVAHGKWILFLDDDDWWMHEYVLEQLAGKLQNEDVLRFSFIWKGKGYTECGDWFAVWNKVWKRSFIGDTRFPWDEPIHADVPFHRAMMAKHPRITDWDMPMYYYNYMREGSLSWLEKQEQSL